MSLHHDGSRRRWVPSPSLTAPISPPRHTTSKTAPSIVTRRIVAGSGTVHRIILGKRCASIRIVRDGEVVGLPKLVVGWMRRIDGSAPWLQEGIPGGGGERALIPSRRGREPDAARANSTRQVTEKAATITLSHREEHCAVRCRADDPCP